MSAGAEVRLHIAVFPLQSIYYSMGTVSIQGGSPASGLQTSGIQKGVHPAVDSTQKTAMALYFFKFLLMLRTLPPVCAPHMGESHAAAQAVKSLLLCLRFKKITKYNVIVIISQNYLIINMNTYN